MYLRIALELYLKRVVVGGIERVYEIGRIFRNEGVDSTHSPEFTMLEAYEAYGDYDTMAALTRDIVLDAARGHRLDRRARRPGRRDRPRRAVALGHRSTRRSRRRSAQTSPSTPTSRRCARSPRSPTSRSSPDWDHGQVVLELFEKLVEHTLLQPTFVRDYPASVRPLARPHRDDPRLVEAWDLVIGGVELAPAYSELVDPVEQRDG